MCGRTTNDLHLDRQPAIWQEIPVHLLASDGPLIHSVGFFGSLGGGREATHWPLLETRPVIKVASERANHVSRTVDQPFIQEKSRARNPSLFGQIKLICLGQLPS